MRDGDALLDAVHRDRLDEVADLPVAPNRRP